MAENQGGGGQQRQQPPKQQMITCPQCGKQTAKDKPHCYECGKPLEVQCSNCGIKVPNTKYCSNCGVPLAANNPSMANKPKVENWELECSSVGKAGRYTIRVQATKNGIGEQVGIAIATAMQVFSRGDGLARLAESEIRGKDFIPGKVVKSDQAGLLVVEVEFSHKKEEINFSIQGRQADTWVSLSGPRHEALTSGSLIDAFGAAVKYHKK